MKLSKKYFWYNFAVKINQSFIWCTLELFYFIIFFRLLTKCERVSCLWSHCELKLNISLKQLQHQQMKNVCISGSYTTQPVTHHTRFTWRIDQLALQLVIFSPLNNYFRCKLINIPQEPHMMTLTLWLRIENLSIFSNNHNNLFFIKRKIRDNSHCKYTRYRQSKGYKSQ